ncbi:6824_t:CDS:2 [Entrophospora sp. SA101]|nr:6824_t:CDS:2 [Entrophospora sp. SA101]CAJ0842604.1 19795_t:CDS:2 [Entrophospora sp. SA101]CAJ0899276.1 6032_t:CDS:2 [Entrophospora sp. SA101]
MSSSIVIVFPEEPLGPVGMLVIFVYEKVQVVRNILCGSMLIVLTPSMVMVTGLPTTIGSRRYSSLLKMIGKVPSHGAKTPFTNEGEGNV